MRRFLISSRSSLSQRSTVLPRADAHWFWKQTREETKVIGCHTAERQRTFKEIKNVTQTAQTSEMKISSAFLQGEEEEGQAEKGKSAHLLQQLCALR